MSELNDFINVAKANEQYNFNLSPIISNTEDQHNIDHLDKIDNSPSTESFSTKHMNRAWTVCYGTTAIILLFLLFLWGYFETTDKQNWNNVLKVHISSEKR